MGGGGYFVKNNKISLHIFYTFIAISNIFRKRKFVFLSKNKHISIRGTDMRAGGREGRGC